MGTPDGSDAVMNRTISSLTLEGHDTHLNARAAAGVAMAVAAYAWWAVATPLYYSVVDQVPVGELLAWRVLSGIPAMGLLLWATGRLGELRAILGNKRVLGLLAVSAVLISVNWVVFVWSVIDNRLSEASLGYYINPLVWVALGRIVLGERMRGPQWVAVALAIVGVSVLAWRIGGLPWISLALATSFALYGLVRKQVAASPAAGLTVEMMLLSPLMCILLWLDHVAHGNAVLAGPWWVSTLLLLGGVVTAVPLVLFAGGAKRLQLTTMGMLQYIAPTGQLLLAVWVFGESFGTDRLIAFCFIWAAVLTYSADSVRQARKARRVDAEVMVPGEA